MVWKRMVVWREMLAIPMASEMVVDRDVWTMVSSAILQLSWLLLVVKWPVEEEWEGEDWVLEENVSVQIVEREFPISGEFHAFRNHVQNVVPKW